jgi:hypothetical protein
LYNKKLFNYILINILKGYQVIRFKLNYDRKSIIIKHIKINQPLNILEIVVNTGGFAIRMLSQLSKSNPANTSCTGVDLFAEMQTRQNHKAERSMWLDSRNDIFKKIEGSAPDTKVNLIHPTSFEFFVRDKNKYDSIFIDDYASRNDAVNSSFGISKAVEEINTNTSKIKIFNNMDFLKKNGELLL